MTSKKRKKTELHKAARSYARECTAGKLSRREFLTRATALGVVAPAAYGLLGLTPPAAQAQTPQMGGSLRFQMAVMAQRDPRTWDWGEMANVCRGWLEYLVSFERDGTSNRCLLESWDANEDATQYTLNLRPGVTWNNGDTFTAEDVLHNISRWCDASVEGNSMANRFGALAQDGKLRDDAVEIVDDLTVRLNLSSPDITSLLAWPIIRPPLSTGPLTEMTRWPTRSEPAPTALSATRWASAR